MDYTENDIKLLREHNKKVRMTVKLLDSVTYQEVDNITGNIVALSYDKAYDSDIRATCSVTLSVYDKSQINTDFEKTWNKQMVELFCGIYDRKNKQYVDYSLGRMLMQSGSTQYDATTQEITLSLVDLMASMTEERGSQIGSSTYIPATEEGINIRTLLINIIQNFAVYKRYEICEFDDTLPYDLEFESGIYPIEMLRKVLDLFPYYEMFYDNNGIFTVQKIPTKIDEPVDISNDIIDDLIISEGRDNDFSEIKNTTEIWGRELECDYVSSSCLLSGSVYNVEVDSTLVVLEDGSTYSVVPDSDSVENQEMNINNLGQYSIYSETGAGEYIQIAAGSMVAGRAYSIRYFQQRYILVGELQIRCIVQEINAMPTNAAKQYYKEENNCDNVEWVVNPDNPYACSLEPTTGRIIGEIKQVLDDGEYADIYSTELAYERARYENWLKCRLQDKVTIKMVLIPWMDINQKIQFTSHISGELATWIVQSISYNFEEWTMDVTASRFYPYYPW